MFIVDCQIYPFDIMVCFGDKSQMFKDLSKYLSKEQISDFKKETFKNGCATMFTTGQTVLWLYKKPENGFDLSLLAHEIFHCATLLLGRVGIPLTESSEEAYAYFIQFLTEKIYNELNITF